MALRLLFRILVLGLALMSARSGVAQTPFVWLSPAGGSWFTGTLWDAATAYPNNVTSHAAVILATGAPYTITTDGGAIGLKTLDVSSADATVVFNFTSSGLGLTLGSGVSNLSSGLVEVQTASGVHGAGTAATTLSLGGTGELRFTTMTGTRSLGNLTLNNSGTVRATTGTLSISNATAFNNLAGGLLHADGAQIAFQNGTTLANAGTLRATGSAGVLRFNGTVATAELGSVELVDGGRAQLAGTLNNADDTLSAPSGGAYELVNGTIAGGTVDAGAVAFTSSGGTLSGAVLTGDLELPAGARVDFSNGGSFTGANLTLGSGSHVYWKQNAALAGKAVTLGENAYVYVTGAGNALTLDAETTAEGDIYLFTDGTAGTTIANAGTIKHTSTGSGTIYARSLTNSGTIGAGAGTLRIGSTSAGYDTTNTGTIIADGTSSSSYGTIHLDGNVDNDGTIVAEDHGRIYFHGTNSTANLGAVQIGANGRVLLNGTLANDGATLTAPSGGTFELLGGTIMDGAVDVDALTFTSSTGTLSGVTLNGDFSLPASTYVNFTDGTTFTGANAALGGNAGVLWKQVGTLSGKTLTFGSGAYLLVTGAGNALTLAADATATGDVMLYADGSAGAAITNAGTIMHTSANSGSLNAPAFTNTGSISADAGSLFIGSTGSGYATVNSGSITAGGTTGSSFGTIYLEGDVNNTGTITAENFGQVYFRGANTTGQLGTVQIGADGHVYLAGTLDNADATLTAPSGGTYELRGGTIQGGAVSPAALTFTNSGGTLSGVAWHGDFALPSSTYVYWTNGTALSGSNLSLGASAGLYWQQTDTVAGKALALGANSYLMVTGAGHGLTLGSGTSVSGDVTIRTDGSTGTSITNEGAIAHTGGYGEIYGGSFTNAAAGTITATGGTLTIGTTAGGYATTNAGTIVADGGSARVNVIAVDGTGGTLWAKNAGAIALQGSIATSELGAVKVESGGHVYIEGTIDNSEATLAAPVGGSYELRGGTIGGGTIGSGALAFTNYGGTLDGATLTGDLTLAGSASVRFKNVTGFSGGLGSLGSGAYLYWEQADTWIGKALTFAANSMIYLTGANSTLTFGEGTTATGDIGIGSDGSAGVAFANEGTITHTSGSGSIHAPAIENWGTIAVSGGTLYLGGTSAGATLANQAGGALVVSAAGNLVLQSPAATPIVNLGTIDVQSGILYTGGRLTNGAGGWLRGAGTINGGMAIDGGTIAPGNAGIGTLTFSGGTFAVTSPATFAIELGGGTGDAIVFQNPGSNIDIGAGLLTLSLTLLSAPTADTTYDLIRIGSGTNTIGGYFAGLPNSGDTLTAMFGGNTFSFTIQYAPNAISLFTPVPEPETYMLLAAGVSAMAILWRRRRARS